MGERLDQTGKEIDLEDYVDGDDGIYTGQLIKGIPYGQGTWTDADGNEYVLSLIHI